MILNVLLYALISHNVTLKATGLTCSMCSFSIQKGIEKIHFVDSVKPNLEETTYTIYFKNSLVKNIGLDGTGVNCKVNYELNQKKFTSKNVYVNKKQIIQENFRVKKDIANYLKSSFGLNKKLFYAFKQFLS